MKKKLIVFLVALSMILIFGNAFAENVFDTSTNELAIHGINIPGDGTVDVTLKVADDNSTCDIGNPCTGSNLPDKWVLVGLNSQYPSVLDVPSSFDLTNLTLTVPSIAIYTPLPISNNNASTGDNQTIYVPDIYNSYQVQRFVQYYSNITMQGQQDATTGDWTFTVIPTPQSNSDNTQDPGTAATISVGSVVTGSPGTQATVTNVGTPNAAVLDFVIPRGTQGLNGAAGQNGSQGPAGSPGLNATITVGSTTTGAAGTDATVTNTGTSNAAVLNFTIPQGSQGPSGPPVHFLGPWTSTTTYNIGDAVSFNGSSYISMADNNIGVQPGSFFSTNWDLLAEEGSQGTNGTAATVTVGSTTTAPYGTPANVTNSGTSSNAVLNFVLPQGSPGAPGPAATVAVGTVTTGAAGTSAIVTNSGTPTAAVLNFTIPQGEPGTGGGTGGSTTVSVGTVTTGAPGSQATVTNSGTSQNVVLNFTIPAGADGTQGNQGPPITFMGTWDPSMMYDYGYAVYYNGSSYVSMINMNTDMEPDTNPSAWSLLAQGATLTSPSRVATVAESGGDYTNPWDAYQAIGSGWCVSPGPSAADPCIMKIMPGVYTVSGTISLPNYVEVKGSGIDITVIQGDVYSSGTAPNSTECISNDQCGDIFYVPSGANVEDLTVINGGSHGGSGSQVGIMGTSVYHVKVIVNGNTENNYGIVGGTVKDATVNVSGASGDNNGFWNVTELDDSTATTSGGTRSIGAYSTSWNTTISNSTLSGTFGIYSLNGILHVRNSVLSGSINSAINDSGNNPVYIANTELEGAVSVVNPGLSFSCVGDYDATFTALNTTCQ